MSLPRTQKILNRWRSCCNADSKVVLGHPGKCSVKRLPWTPSTESSSGFVSAALLIPVFMHMVSLQSHRKLQSGDWHFSHLQIYKCGHTTHDAKTKPWLMSTDITVYCSVQSHCNYNPILKTSAFFPVWGKIYALIWLRQCSQCIFCLVY